MPYVALFAIVFGINLLPAFGPPTWAVLVFARLHWHLNPVGLVAIGTIAAMSGRYVLARCTRLFRPHLPTRMQANLEGAQSIIERRRMGALAGLALFAVSPLPSAQLFVAAGLLDVPLGPVTLAFGLGRLVSYSIYVGLATLADKQLGNVLGQDLTAPWAIALEVVLIAGVCALPLIDWNRLLKREQPAAPSG